MFEHLWSVGLMSENRVANPLFVKGRFSCLNLASLLLEERYSLAWISVLDCLKRNAPSDRTKVLCRRNDQRRKKVDQIGSSAIDLKTLSIFFFITVR